MFSVPVTQGLEGRSSLCGVRGWPQVPAFLPFVLGASKGRVLSSWSPTLGLQGQSLGLLALQIQDPKAGPESRLSQFGCPLTGPESSPLLPCSPWITHHPGLCPLLFLRCPKPGAVHGHGNLRNWAEVILTPGLVSLVGKGSHNCTDRLPLPLEAKNSWSLPLRTTEVMNERLTKTREGNWLDLSFFSFRENPRTLWGHTALLAGTLDREGGLSVILPQIFRRGSNVSSISGPLLTSPDPWPMTLVLPWPAVESPQMRPAGRLLCELFGGVLRGTGQAGPGKGGGGWGGAAQPGSRLYSLCVTEANAWPPSLQDVGDPGPEWTSRAGSQDSRPPRRPVVAGLTREMVRGTLKSRPPTRRKPQGEGPRRVTEWGIASRSRSRSLSRTLRSRRRPRRRLDAAPRPRPARPLTPPPPGPRPRSLRAGIGPAADPTLPLRGALRTRPSAPTACSPAPRPGSQDPGP